MATTTNERSPYEIFVDLVESMREHQKQYFEHRRKDDLRKSKRYEALVDIWLAQHKQDLEKLKAWRDGLALNGGDNGQKNMFDL